MRGWRDGKVGFRLVYMNDIIFPVINSDVVGIVSFPVGPSGHGCGGVNARLLGLYSRNKLIPVRDAAWEYMRFKDSRRAMKIRISELIDHGWGQFVNPLFLRETGHDKLIRLVQKTWKKTFYQALSDGVVEPYVPYNPIIYSNIASAVMRGVELEKSKELPRDLSERKRRLKMVLNEAARIAEFKMSVKH
jgi:hypothetical protein